MLLHVEGAIVLAASLWAYALVDGSWGWFALLILAPDLSMVGYLAGPRIGSYAYDAAHTYVGPALLAAAMALHALPAAWWIVLIWTAHIGGDRMLGYGLKQVSGFRDTHLQQV